MTWVREKGDRSAHHPGPVPPCRYQYGDAAWRRPAGVDGRARDRPGPALRRPLAHHRRAGRPAGPSGLEADRRRDGRPWSEPGTARHLPDDLPRGDQLTRPRHRDGTVQRLLPDRAEHAAVHHRDRADHDPDALRDVCEQLEQYFAGEREVFDVELDLSGTPLRRALRARPIPSPSSFRPSASTAAPAHPSSCCAIRSPAACCRCGLVRWKRKRSRSRYTELSLRVQ